MISEYFYAFAGFNEELIQAEVGYLQEIHIFVSSIINEEHHASVIEAVRKYSHPFPFIIFTPSGHIRKPAQEVCHSSCTIRMTDDSILQKWKSLVIYEQGTGHITPPADDGTTEHPGSQVGQSVEDKNSQVNNTSNTGTNQVEVNPAQQETDTNHMEDQVNQQGEEVNDSRQQTGDQTNLQILLSHEDSSGAAQKPEVDFSVKPSSTPFPTQLRQLKMDGTFTAERKEENNWIHSMVTFSRITCQSLSVKTYKELFNEDLKDPPYNFSQFHLQIAVSTECKDAHLHYATPQSTLSEDKEQKATQGTKSSLQVTGGIGVSSSGVTGTLGANTTKESSSGVEKKLYKSGIVQSHDNGKIWWNYTVDDVSECCHGKDVASAELPQVNYRLQPQSSRKINDIHVIVNSYWTVKPILKVIGTTAKGLKDWLKKPRPKEPAGFSTIVQSVKITVPHTIQKRYRFEHEFSFGALNWSTSSAENKLPESVSDDDGKLEANAQRIPDKNCKEIPNIIPFDC
ncbi:hypothetical protein M422DRAFT_71418 [Sphaerobolus stellatus SS14]|uniref:Uncharacterized protein n=1 Tax=Sphaerobolus stellatus (strain SS14) TaxID=990650 RepID=A0A0C9USY9_SPHS4|nr:hypothetical protein M422DRAFT_71418 [Sphaerobolus stellatus SS14]